MASVEARFDGLYDRYYRQVLAYCLRRCDPADGYAAANEVFAIAWRRIDDVPEGEVALPWLYVVARRVVWKQRRGSTRFRRLVARVGSLPRTGESDPETVVVQRSEYEDVLDAARRLSRADQEVLRLAAWEGLPHAQIAEILGCSVAAVDQRLHRAKVRLTKLYRAATRHGPSTAATGGRQS
jgi:RNA polymerase sigma-70 factor (ECF subfamily)